MERQLVNLSEFFNSLQSVYSLPLGKEIVLNWNLPSEFPAVVTDGAKLKQILQNIINNAIKFTEKGHMTVSAQTLPGEKIVEFKVADTGIGISREHLPIIFEKFLQADSSETRLYGGVGLGLYIARRFSELLGGAVEVESEPGKGSTFTMRIPVES